jgi:hypothetical protein
MACPELCNHVDEVPNVCPCGPDCYCKTRSCWRPWTQNDECLACRLKAGSPMLCMNCQRRRTERDKADPGKKAMTSPPSIPDCDCGEAYSGNNCKAYCARKAVLHPSSKPTPKVNIEAFLAPTAGTAPTSPEPKPRNLLQERFDLLDLEGLEGAEREPDPVRLYDFEGD